MQDSFSHKQVVQAFRKMSSTLARVCIQNMFQEDEVD